MLWRHSPASLTIGVVLGLLSGVLNALVIIVIQHAVRGAEIFGVSSSRGTLALFVLFASAQVGITLAMSVILTFAPNGFMDALRREIVASLIDVPYATLERRGGGETLAALTEEIQIVTGGVMMIPNVLVNISITVGVLIYIGLTSFVVFGLLLLGLVLVIGSYLLIDRRNSIRLKAYFQLNRALFTDFESLVRGAKELRTNRRRRDVFYEEHLVPRLDAVRSFQRKNFVFHHLRGAFTGSTAWIVLALVIFAAPHFGAKATIELIMFVVYLTGPVMFVVTAFAYIQQADRALHSMEHLRSELAGTGHANRLPVPTFSRAIELVGIEHTYRIDGPEREFRLGPLSLSMHVAEILLVVGGNGSGKSTLAKIIAGLYEPAAGQLLVDGVAVETAAQREAYRQLFATVFPDYHLFEWIPDAEVSADRVNRLLVDFRLDHVVEFKDSRFSTTKLSTGQRKRLAMVVACVEDRQVYVFDEWAADQDPVFKKVFYQTLLPGLRAAGKTCVVVSHDDQYFAACDRVVRLEAGQILPLVS